LTLCKYYVIHLQMSYDVQTSNKMFLGCKLTPVHGGIHSSPSLFIPPTLPLVLIVLYNDHGTHARGVEPTMNGPDLLEHPQTNASVERLVLVLHLSSVRLSCQS